MEKSELIRVLDNLFDAAYFVDRDRKITYWNNGAERLTGFTSLEMLGKDCRKSMLVHLSKDGQPFCDSHCPLQETEPYGDVRETEVFLRHKAGHMVPVQTRMVPLRDAEGYIRGAAEIFSDTSVSEEMRKRLDALERVARLDPLTRLPNRRYIEERVAAHLAELERYDRRFGLIFLDLDRFERINDRFGCDAGDEVLRMIARTLMLSYRPFDTVGRWDEEQFAAIPVQVDRETVRVIAERTRILIEQSQLPWQEGASLGVTASLGGTLIQRGDKVDSIINRADKLLRQAKEKGGDVVVVGD
jgi:diguanylate cyclase (GGDEF)-like protein/PAS domain S-box-containing protein